MRVPPVQRMPVSELQSSVQEIEMEIGRKDEEMLVLTEEINNLRKVKATFEHAINKLRDEE